MVDRASQAGTENDAADAIDAAPGASPAAENSDRSTRSDGANPGDASAAPAAKSPAADPNDPDANNRPAMRDVVKAALAKSPATDANSSIAAEPGSEADPNAANANKDAKAEDGSAEQDVPFHNHPRWKQVVSERDAYKADVERFKPDAEQYGKVQAFMQEHKLAPAQVGEGFTIMAMMGSGTEEGMRGALARLDHYRDNLMLALGDKLPADLQDKVDKGLMDDVSAKEVAKSRLASAGVTAKSAEIEAAEEARRKASIAAADEKAQGDMSAAVKTWETEQSKRDPGFTPKRQLVRDRAYMLMQREHSLHGTLPRTPDEAVKFARDAYAELSKELGWTAAAPRKPTTTTRTLTSRPASTATPGQPTSMRDAVLNGLNQR